MQQQRGSGKTAVLVERIIRKIIDDKVDIDKLIEIEGEEDNIFENKIPKVSKWLDLSKKFGTTCELVK